LQKKHAALRKVADDAEASYLRAEDVLTSLEDREARRGSRSAAGEHVPPALAARLQGA
jgi:hypothetical protein